MKEEIKKCLKCGVLIGYLKEYAENREKKLCFYCEEEKLDKLIK